MLSRLIRVRVDGAWRAFVLLEDLIARHVNEFFPRARLRGTYPFRVTRNWDLEIDEEEGEDLLQTIQAELRRRDRGNAVRVEIGVGEGVEASVTRLCKALHVDPTLDVYRVPGPLYITDLLAIVGDDERRELRDEIFTPQVPVPFRDVDDPFAVIRERDILLHLPYESFDPVVEFVSRAADDPNVLAIKQTLYRTGGDSPIVKALARAAESGKQVTAIVELKARFDEASNIQWARTLEQSGVQVIYGLLGLKTHVKALLVVRREKDKLRRYVHVSTGNYNPQTARIYSDFGLFTVNKEIGEDVTSLFNLLTGYSAPNRWNRLVAAPLGLHEAILGLIARESAHARAGKRAQIVAQMNALVDVDVIDALYAASQAGVDIRLFVRGICCLRPGLPDGPLGDDPRLRARRSVPRARAHVPLRERRSGGGVHLERRLDAAQLPPPRRAAPADPRSRRERARDLGQRHDVRRQHEDVGAPRRRHVREARAAARRAARARAAALHRAREGARPEQGDARCRAAGASTCSACRSRTSATRRAARTAWQQEEEAPRAVSPRRALRT